MARLGVLLGYLLVLIYLNSAYSANILFFWGMGGYSHRLTAWPMVEKLAERGHKITFFSAHPPKRRYNNPNITEITPKDIFNRIGMGYHPAEIRIEKGIKAIDNLWYGFVEAGLKLTEILTQDKEFLQWVDNASFDLVVVHALFNDIAYGLAWKWKVPTMLYSPTSLCPWWGESYGIPEENYPEFQFHLPFNMNFIQEVQNTLIPLFWHAYRQWYYLPKMDSLIRPAFKVEDMPSLLEMEQRNAIILTNTHFSEEYPRSLPPWIISVGGQHCSDNTNPLPENLQNFVDKWDEIIYFSFGTYMKIPLLPDHIKNAILGTIKKFPKIGFVMKWSGAEVPSDIPENIYAADWLSQQDILAHPKVRVFIHHGGLLSTQESIFHKVPMIVFPIFAEQDYNAQRIHSTERGIMMEIGELTEDKFQAAITELLTNKKYKDNVVQTSLIFRDRPINPVDNSVYWVEYAIKHKKTPFLRPVGVTRTWYQRRMLHIWGFLALVGVFIVWILLLIVKCTCSCIFRFKRNSQKLKLN